ncbi:MAG: YcaO-like family protein [Proteobacteria bacterium]|nr:YcaO-like family protein [Pseudomonadota bacterium]
MLEKTYLVGKTDYLESSIDRMTKGLEAYGFALDFSQWLNPAPYIHSVHVKSADCPALFANGKGISAKAAQASAMGEFVERLGTHYLFADYFLGQKPSGFLMHPQEINIPVTHFSKEKVLTPELWALYDAHDQVDGVHLVALQDGDDAITAIPLLSVADNTQVFFPVNLLNSLYASNGLAAGNSLLEASIQGLSEVLERWVRIQILRNNWCLPKMPEKVWRAFTTVVEAVEKLALQGIECDIRDASLGGNYPVVAIILRDIVTGKVFVSFGAHPIYEVALERTLTESLQGRLLSSRDGFDYPSVDKDFVASDENLEMHFIDASGRWHLSFFGNQPNFSAVAWSLTGDVEAQWQTLLASVNQAGFQVYWQHHQQLALHVVRLVVPGMSEIYPMSDLLDGNANRGLVLRHQLNYLDWNKDRSFEQLLALLDEQAYPAHTRVASLIGLLADPGTPWSWLTIAELKLGCFLFLGDFEAALQALAEVFAIGRNEPAYHALEMALGLLLIDELETQAAALLSLFGETLWQQIVEWIDGETFLWDIELSHSERYSARHQALLRAHERINAALSAV